MEDWLKIIIALAVLLLGIPIGNLLAKYTKEELKIGRVWFRFLMLAGVIGGVLGLIFQKDALMFTLFFIAIVSSRSLR